MHMSISNMLQETGFLHEPLPLSAFQEGDLALIHGRSEVISSYTLDEKEFYREAPICLDEWPLHLQPDGDYCNFGTIEYSLKPSLHNWEKYTRLRFQAKAEGIGNRSPFIYVHLTNEGKEPMPDVYGRTGLHQISLVYGEWVDCTWEIAELPRDCITGLRIELLINGSDNAVGETTALHIKDVRLEESTPFINSGWGCHGFISYSQSGYRLKGIKQALTMEKVGTFELYKDGQLYQVLPAREVLFKGEAYYLLDFSSVKEKGTYLLKAGSLATKEFCIDDEVFMPAVLKLCSFIFAERCGYPIPGKHLICHSDVKVSHKGKILSYNGGWHDAGDMSQQTLQSGEITLSLYQAAEKARSQGEDLLARRLMEEARWGAAFLLKTRFGDGFRATSAGLTRYTRGFMGDMDDVAARCHNHDFENFMLSMVEAESSDHEYGRDQSLSDQLFQAAVEDFDFAMEEMGSWETNLPSFFEHSYNSSFSLHLCAAICAACSIVSIWQKRKEKENETVRISSTDYAALIRTFTSRLISLQERSSSYGISGFFYRSTSEKEPVHFNHQSREYLFAEALTRAYNTLEPQFGADMDKESDPLLKALAEAIKAYGGYLKQLMTYASPYGMIPAGVQMLREAENEHSFSLLHLFADYKSMKESMIRQIREGVHVGRDAYVRQFPVWFSFRGNHTVMLSQGMSARILGEFLQDEELKAIADQQLYFICGLNPFGQSMIYGEGHRYAPQYAAQPGQMAGEIPVGIETYGDKDEPYYPEATNATYKEIWTTPAARFLAGL